MSLNEEKKIEIIKNIDFNLEVLKLMHNKSQLKISDKAIEKLIHANGADNSQVIEKALEQAVQKCAKLQIEPEDIELQNQDSELELPVGLKLETVERQYILQTLYFVQQNRTKAAEILGISIRTLRNKLSQYRTEGYL